MTNAPRPWPTKVQLKKAERSLTIAFDDGEIFDLSAEYLRVESPSAEVQGHGGDQKKIVGGKKDVAITTVEPVGNYAVRLIFDDGHDTGLYSWDALYHLGHARDQIWQTYLDALEQSGQRRQPL